MCLLELCRGLIPPGTDVQTNGNDSSPPPSLSPSLQVSVKKTFAVKEKLGSLLYTYSCSATASNSGRQCQALVTGTQVHLFQCKPSYEPLGLYYFTPISCWLLLHWVEHLLRTRSWARCLVILLKKQMRQQAFSRLHVTSAWGKTAESGAPNSI